MTGPGGGGDHDGVAGQGSDPEGDGRQAAPGPDGVCAHGRVRVAIVDDHEVTRVGLAAVLGACPRFEVGASTADPASLGDPAQFGLILLDLYLSSEEPCLDAVAALSEHTRVLVMSASRYRGDALAVLQAGARGYLTKNMDTQQILAGALATVDGSALSPDLADFLSADLTDPALRELTALAEPLSSRQLEALDLIAQGYTHGQVARRMGIAESTVDTHVQRVRDKLRLGNKAELTRVALALRAARTDRPARPL